MTLRNKVVVITGSSKGLGKALARAFISEKARVIITARSRSELKRASNELGATACVGDVTKEADMKRLALFAFRKYGTIDIWINNAGLWMPHSEIEEINPKRARALMDVNFFGTFYGSRAAIGVMKKRRRGTIINIVSMSALVGRPRSAGYASSKWATRGFTESLRMAMEPHGITVIAVHPGGMKTTIFKGKAPAGYDTWMEPAYVARSILQNLKRKKPRKELVVWHGKGT